MESTREASDNNSRLSRKQQIELMKECRDDSRKVLIELAWAGAPGDVHIAAAFFEYRTREGC